MNTIPCIFLGANSADGFMSYFYQSGQAKKGWFSYLIKGGPGSGKSTFLRRVAATANQRGETALTVLCGSDPDSLDGVILPEHKIMLLDATAPHTVEPLYAGACEELLPFNRFWDRRTLRKNYKDIIIQQDAHKALMGRASRLLSGMGRLQRERMRVSLVAADLEKTTDFAARLAHRYLEKQSGVGQEQTILLDAVTPKGPVFLSDTLRHFADTFAVIRDEYLTAATLMLSVIRDVALGLGYEIVTVRDSLLPEDCITQVIIPSLRLAFCSERQERMIPVDARRIHADRFYDPAVLHSVRNRLRAGKRLYTKLEQSAAETLALAKTQHDRLEDYYKAAMDFHKLEQFSDTFINTVLFAD